MASRDSEIDSLSEYIKKLEQDLQKASEELLKGQISRFEEEQEFISRISTLEHKLREAQSTIRGLKDTNRRLEKRLKLQNELSKLQAIKRAPRFPPSTPPPPPPKV